MGEDKPLFPLLARDGSWKAGDEGWMWQWIQSSYPHRNIQPGDMIVEMELSRVVNGGNWMIYIGRKEHVATAHLFRWDDQDRSRSWKKVAERDFRVRLPTKNYKMVSYMEKVIPKAAIWAEEIMYPADKYLYLKTKQNPASDWLLADIRPVAAGKTYSYRNRLKPQYILAFKVKKVDPRSRLKKYTSAVVLYSGRSGAFDAKHGTTTALLARVGELDEVHHTRITGTPGVLSSFKYPAMAWADELIYAPDEYLYLKTKRNPSPQGLEAAVQGLFARYTTVTSLGAAQKFYVELGEALGRPEYYRYGGHLPKRGRGMPKAPERPIITQEQALKESKIPAIAEREIHRNRSWRRKAKEMRRRLERDWGAVVRVTREDLPKKKKEKKVKKVLTPEEQTARLLERLTARQTKDRR